MEQRRSNDTPKPHFTVVLFLNICHRRERAAWLCWLFILLSIGSLGAESFYVDYSKSIEIEAVLAHPQSILHPTVELDLQELTSEGHLSLGYLSIGEIAVDAPYRDRAIASGVNRPMTNAIWKSDVVDLSSPEWRDFVLNDLAPGIVERGFSGFFLDTMDAVDMLAHQFPERAAAFRTGLAELVLGLRERFPEKKIVVNRGFSVMEAIQDSIDGVLVESVFGSFEHDTGDYVDVSESDTRILLGLLGPLQEAGKSVYILDYADPLDPERGQQLSSRAVAEGFHTFVSTPSLNGVSVAPLRKIPRKVLVLYGNDPSQGPWAPRYPFDSSTFLTLHMCFEWLGIEVEYLNAFQESFEFEKYADFRAILTDQTLVEQ